MAIKARISRSANAIDANDAGNTRNGEVQPPRKLIAHRGVLGRLSKTTQGGNTAQIKREKSDPNLTSHFKTSSGQGKMGIDSKTSETLLRRRGIIQGFSQMVPLQDIQSIKPNCGIKGSRKSSINNEIRRVTSKKDVWTKRYFEASRKSKNYNTFLKTPILDDTKTTEGRRPMLRMPANIPKANKKQRYVITVVGNEIKLLDPKTKGFRMTSEFKPFTSPPTFRKISTLSRNHVRRQTKVKRRKKSKKVICRKESIEGIYGDQLQRRTCNRDGLVGDGMVIELNRADLSEVVGISDTTDREGLRKFYKFSDRRTKAEVPAKAIQVCTGEELLLERLDPISNILSTELLDSVKRCQSVIDFVTAPIENPNPPFMMKQLFYDTTVMDELNFPPLTIAELSRNAVPELKLVPSCLPQQVKKSLSFPDLATIVPKHSSRSLCLSGRKKKKKPKIETILATRPKGFQHAKWLEKTVGVDSTLKSKLLQDVIISQVRKCLKRQAELRQKLQGNSDTMDNRGSDTKSRQNKLSESSNTAV